MWLDRNEKNIFFGRGKHFFDILCNKISSSPPSVTQTST